MSARLATIAFLVAIVAGCAGPEGTPLTPVTDVSTVQADIAQALKDVPIPPGATIAPVLPDDDGNYQAGYGRQAVEGLAICAWFEFWIDALADGRTTDVARAKDVASQFPMWTIYLNADQSFRDVIDDIVDKANLGDPATMASFASTNCH